jgi:hypothetical protein
MGDARGHGSIRFFRLEVLNFLRGGALGYVNPELRIW